MSNDMKLIMENWRTSRLLLEADQKQITTFLNSAAKDSLPDEKVEAVFDKLQQDAQFKELMSFFSEIEALPVDEGLIDDAMASLSVKGMSMIDALKDRPGGQKLANAAPAIMALAYAASKWYAGDLDMDDLETVATIMKKGAQTDLNSIAAAGG